MRVDPGTPGVEIAREYAVRLGVPIPTDRGVRRVPGRKLRIGDQTATVELTIVEHPPDPFHERAVVGTLGRAVFAGRVLRLDPGRGRLTITDDAGYGEALDDWRLPVEFGEHRILMRVNWSTATGRIDSRTAAAAGLVMHPGPVGPGAWSGPASIGGLPPRPLAFAASERSETGSNLFQDLVVVLDHRGHPKISFATAQAQPQCSDCVTGTVTKIAQGRIELTFDEPQKPLPDGLWARVAFGPHDCLSVLVRLTPRPYRPYRATAKYPHLVDDYLPTVGEPVRVVDTVQLAAGCKGEVCLRDPRVHPIFVAADPDSE